MEASAIVVALTSAFRVFDIVLNGFFHLKLYQSDYYRACTSVFGLIFNIALIVFVLTAVRRVAAATNR